MVYEPFLLLFNIYEFILVVKILKKETQKEAEDCFHCFFKFEKYKKSINKLSINLINFSLQMVVIKRVIISLLLKFI